MTIVHTENLRKYYNKGLNQVKAMDGIDMQIEEGQFCAIVGASGSGKSTLLHMLGGLDTPTEGRVRIKGHDLSKLSPDALTVFRRQKIGFVFQHFNLIPILSVYENIVFPLHLDGQDVDKAHLEEVTARLGITEKLTSMPNYLSGGQQQRVAIARALATKPDVILADEPTGNLDTQTGQEVMTLLRGMSTQFNQTIIMITHNPELAKQADRIVHLEDGRLRQGVTA